jgi:TldD protein
LYNLNLYDYTKLFSGYSELRAQENRVVSIVFVKGNNTVNSRSATSGISARVYKNGSWGFASNPEISEAAAKAVIQAATENAVFLDSKELKGKGPLPKSPVKSENDFSTKKPRLGQRELVEFIRQLDDHIARKYPDLASRTVSLSCLDMEKTLITSDGSYSHSLVPRTTVGIALSFIKDSEPVEFARPYGGLGHFEDLFTSPEDLFNEIEEQYHHLMKKSEGVFADAGLKTCVLAAELAGILAHEAIGHTTEADMVISGSVAQGKIGRQVASPLVTLVDFAHSYNGQVCPVPVYVDDEGTEAKDAVLIEDGILKGYMHNKESARYFSVEPTGNARAYQFSDEPLIRMRNTAILPGTDKLEDMIASIDDGYYLIQPSNGQADSTSEFMFGITLGYEIKNGKIGKAIKDTTISGVAFDMLQTVTMVSPDMKWHNSGMCGKKQGIPVGMGGPAIKCKINIGGR